MIGNIIAHTVLGCFALLDSAQLRLPNWCTFGFLGAGLLYYGIFSFSLPSFILRLVLCFLLFLSAGTVWGEGDAKAIMGLFFWCDMEMVLMAIALSQCYLVCLDSIKAHGRGRLAKRSEVAYMPYLFFAYSLFYALNIGGFV